MIQFSVLDTELNIVQTNWWMTQKYSDQIPLPGQKCYQVYQQIQSPCPWCPSLAAIETGETQTTIVPYPSAENPTDWMELTAFPVKDEQGNTINIIEYVKDITERRRAEEKLEKYRSHLEELVEARTGELKKSEEDLKEKIKELEIFYDAAIDRELRMEELRKEIEELKKNTD